MAVITEQSMLKDFLLNGTLLTDTIDTQEIRRALKRSSKGLEVKDDTVIYVQALVQRELLRRRDQVLRNIVHHTASPTVLFRGEPEPEDQEQDLVGETLSLDDLDALLQEKQAELDAEAIDLEAEIDTLKLDMESQTMELENLRLPDKNTLAEGQAKVQETVKSLDSIISYD